MPNKTYQYCDVMNSHQESETQSLSSASNDDVTTDEVSGGVSGTVSVHNVKTVTYCERQHGCNCDAS